MAGAREDPPVAGTGRAGGALDRRDHRAVERRERHPPVVLELVRDALVPARLADEPVQPRQRPVEGLVAGIAHVDRERHLPRDRVDDVRADREVADRGDHVAAELAGDPPYARHDRGGGDERVVADPHGRRARVVLDALDRQARPGDGDDALDDADREAFLLEPRPLLDVELEISAHRTRDAGLGSEVADALELVQEPDPILVARVVGVLERDLACQHAAREHGRLEARALLVGEDHERHRVARPDPVVVQRPDRLEGAEDAELAVVLAAGRYGIHVGAHHHGRERLGARALAEDVPHLVDRDAQAGLAHARDHPVAAALVLVGERQAGEPAPGGLADLPQLFDGPLEPPPVDPHGSSCLRARDTRASGARRRAARALCPAAPAYRSRGRRRDARA